MNRNTFQIKSWHIVLGVLLLWGGISYNRIVHTANNVHNKWADLQSTYQRRLDLVNQIMPIVQTGAAQELAVFETLRDQAAALSGNLKYDEFGQPMIPEGEKAQQLAQQLQAFDQALNNFVVYLADNPDIVSKDLFEDFMIQIEGSENRINVARHDYNEAVTNYRNTVQSFPNNIVAALSGFNVNKFPYFQADQGAQNAPQIVFPTPSYP